MELKFKIGDRVKFDYDGVADTGSVEDIHPKKHHYLIYMDNNRDGHHRGGKCWWVPLDEVFPEVVKKRKFV